MHISAVDRHENLGLCGVDGLSRAVAYKCCNDVGLFQSMGRRQETPGRS